MGLLEMEQTSVGELKKMEKMQSFCAREERILVLVRLRPLSDAEIAANEVADWECINDTTILYRNSLREGSLFPSAYSFDRVFRGDCTTRQLYEEGAKQIALSVLNGINSSIFAYGQTSSGKTYTMNGITEFALADIFDYINMHEERAFVLKFSAIEIYNEAIRDLLTADNSSLRLRDDPEKGTIVEKVTEETLRDWNHFNELVSFCEAQRQIGETSLNERSSRSHQILKLTVESTSRDFLGKDSSTTLVASVNFVDLAGSERASQTLSAGTRLKEGCHINRSLLTLSTVIRKLSNGRNGHINYRDSKLTRILQPALGGNARTAIICTLSPARSHVEQTRNTLMFACCAREVTTKAQVNVVMSDKALVKHLQKEVARLESELKSPAPVAVHGDYAAVLRKKDQQIQKLEKEVKMITKQRDLAQSRVEDLLQMLEDERGKKHPMKNGHNPNENAEDECSESESSLVTDSFDVNPRESPSPPSVGQQSVQSHSYGDSNTVTNGEEDRDGFCKDVPCIESAERECISEACGPSIADLAVTQSLNEEEEEVTSPNMTITEGNEIAEGSHDRRLDDVQNANEFESKYLHLNHGDENARVSRNNSQSSTDTASIAPSIAGTTDEEITTVQNFVAGMKEMADAYKKQLAEKDMLTNAGSDPLQQEATDPSNWKVEFEMKQRMIIELWQACYVPLVHRTYFFLLFRGEPSDSVYLEVELRRLTFMKELMRDGGRAIVAADDGTVTLSSSMKYLHRERAKLSRMMGRRLSREERERLFSKWGIDLRSKERKLQLVSLLWSKTDDMIHINESAVVIAKLVRFPEQANPLKGMLGFSFAASSRRRSLGWMNSKASLPPIPYINRR